MGILVLGPYWQQYQILVGVHFGWHSSGVAVSSPTAYLERPLGSHRPPRPTGNSSSGGGMCRAGPWSHEVWWEHSLRHTGLSHWFAALLAVPSKALGALFFVSNQNWLHGVKWPTLPRSVTRVGSYFGPQVQPH